MGGSRQGGDRVELPANRARTLDGKVKRAGRIHGFEQAPDFFVPAVSLSEQLYDDIDTLEGGSNVDIEKHLRRAEVKAAHAQAWVAVAQAFGSQGERYEGV